MRGSGGRGALVLGAILVRQVSLVFPDSCVFVRCNMFTRSCAKQHGSMSSNYSNACALCTSSMDTATTGVPAQYQGGISRPCVTQARFETNPAGGETAMSALRRRELTWRHGVLDQQAVVLRCIGNVADIRPDPCLEDADSLQYNTALFFRDL